MRIDPINKHTVSPMNSYLFDTNVWLYIYGPMAGSEKRKQKLYAKLLRDIVDKKACLYITSMVLSEYINRVLRIEFDQWKENTGNHNADYKKDFRSTSEYTDSLASVKAQVKEILSFSQKRPDDFNSVNIESIIDSMSNSADYNDIYLVRCCEVGKMCFVSDDNDIMSINSTIKVVKA